MKPKIAIAVDASELDKPGARAKYRFAVEQAGGVAELVGPPQYAASIADLVERFDGVLLPGGADVAPQLYGSSEHPAVELSPSGHDEFQIEVARVAKRAGIPLFGICRGMQVMNVAFGGTLYEDIADQYDAPSGLRLRHQQTPDHGRDETTHVVEIAPGSTLAKLVGTTSLATNSLHHQAVRRIAAGLKPVAAARDGVVEALEWSDARELCLGVQWHPEDLVTRDEPSRCLFRGFVARAAERAERRITRAS